MPTTTASRENWKTFGYWAFWVGVAFFSVYPTCNWLTSQRDVTYPLYLESELGIPFVPEFFWIYSSMYVLFMLPPFLLDRIQLVQLGKRLILATIVSGIIFLLIPTQLGFQRILPTDTYYTPHYENLFILDLPHNLVPSLHVVFSSILILTILDNMRTTVSRLFFHSWLILICLSTLLVHQHHVLDIVTGLFIAIITRKYYAKGEKHG